MPLPDALPKRGGGDVVESLVEGALARPMASGVEGQIGAARIERGEAPKERRDGGRPRAFRSVPSQG